MPNKRIYLSSPTMHELEMRYIQEAFDTNWIAPLGKNVDEFEKEMASYVGVQHAAALNSGTAALHLAIKLCGVQRGDLVFCSDLTFSATVNPVCYEGGIPLFIDSERETWNMDPRALERAFELTEKKPKAVIVVNLYGTPAKLDEIKEICNHHRVPLIEDAAESLGATYNNQQTGTFGVYSALSLVVLKNRTRCQKRSQAGNLAPAGSFISKFNHSDEKRCMLPPSIESCIKMQESRGFGILGKLSFDWVKERTEEIVHTEISVQG